MRRKSVQRKTVQRKTVQSETTQARTGLRRGLAAMMGVACCIMASAAVCADDDVLRSELYAISSEDAEVRKEAITRLVRTKDPRLSSFFRNFQEGNLYLRNDAVFVCQRLVERPDGERVAPLVDPLSGEPVLADGKQLSALQSELRNLSPTRPERRAVRDAILVLQLYSQDSAERGAAAKACGDRGNPAFLATLEELVASESVAKVRDIAHESALLIRLKGEDVEGRLAAAQELGEMRSSRALSTLLVRLEDVEKSEQGGQIATDAPSRAAYEAAVASIEGYQRWVRGFDHLFSGLSLGSILILMALGLSITFGLMGVINMAHGELMMIGAYATYEVQYLFVTYLPEGAFEWYYILAIPTAFVAAALAGFLIEFLVVRHLYGRPLETLLATWGVGLILIQFVRMIYGDNIGVNSPSWLRGGAEIVQDVVLPYNRCFIIMLCGLCVFLIYALLRRTKLGLMVRATMQNRETADSLGVSTRHVDACTFALGAGLAGIAGCALTLVGGVTPDMGQNYIVDSFLVVVTGGVGELVGVVASGLGMGLLNKVLEPFFEAVWAKVLILACVIIFIQFRPAGLFPPKGRLADV